MRNPALDALEGPFTRIARAFSRNSKVRVVFGSGACATDGKTIQIPANADFLVGKAAEVLDGMLDHEWKHVEEESIAVEKRALGWPSPMEIMKRLPDNRSRQLMNVFEDIRIEADARKRYVGVAENLVRTHKFCVELLAEQAVMGKLSAWKMLTCGLISLAKGEAPGFIDSPTRELLGKMDDIIADSLKATNGNDSLALVKRTLRRLEELSVKPEPEPEDADDMKGAGAEEGDEDEGDEGDGEGDGESKPNDDKSDEGDEGSADSDEKGEKGDGDEDSKDGDEGDDGEGADEGEESDEDGDEGKGSPQPGDGEDEADGGADGDDGDEDGDGEGSSGEGSTADEEAETGAEASPAGTGDEGGSDAGPSDEDGDEAAGGAAAVSTATDGAKPDPEDLGHNAPVTDEVPVLSDEGADKALELSRTDDDAKDLMDVVRGYVDKASKADLYTHRRHLSHPEATAKDAFVTPMVTKSMMDLYDKLEGVIRPQISALRSKILTVLRSRREARFVGDQERGALDSSALAGLRMGHKRIFAVRSQVTDQNTAIEVLIDLSGSMGSCYSDERMRSKAEFARGAAIALGECLDQLSIPFEILGFTNISPGPEARRAMDIGVASSIYNRFEPLKMDVFKGFDESYKKTKHRLIAIEGQMNNSDGEAVLLAAKRLAMRPEERKILLVLSDGLPAAYCKDPYLMQTYLREVIQMTKNAGMEVFGLGMQSEAVKEYYPDWAVVSDMNQLASIIFRMLKAYLVKGETLRPKKALRHK